MKSFVTKNFVLAMLSNIIWYCLAEEITKEQVDTVLKREQTMIEVKHIPTNVVRYVLIGELIIDYYNYNKLYKIETNNIIQDEKVARTMFNNIKNGQYVSSKIPVSAAMRPLVFLDEQYNITCAFLYCVDCKPKVVRRFHAAKISNRYYLLRETYENCLENIDTNSFRKIEFIKADGIDKIINKYRPVGVVYDSKKN